MKHWQKIVLAITYACLLAGIAFAEPLLVGKVVKIDEPLILDGRYCNGSFPQALIDEGVQYECVQSVTNNVIVQNEKVQCDEPTWLSYTSSDPAPFGGAVVMSGRFKGVIGCNAIYSWAHPETGEPPKPIVTNYKGDIHTLHGFLLNGCDDCRLVGCEGYANNGDGLYVGNYDPLGGPCQRIRIVGGYFRGARNGCTVADGFDVRFDASRFESLDGYSTFSDFLCEQGNTGDHLKGIYLKGCEFMAGGHKNHFQVALWKTRNPWEIAVENPVFHHRADQRRASGGWEVHYHGVLMTCKGSEAPGQLMLMTDGRLWHEPQRCVPELRPDPG